MNRFNQGLLRYLKLEHLEKIRSFKIGIGGAGGLGSNIAVILARSGFHHFEILDQDTIDPSNLNRQQYFLDEVGKVKVEVLKKRLLDINPDLRITTHRVHWTPETAGDRYFLGCQFIVEAFDQAEWKFRFVEFYQNKARFLISGNGMAGLLEKKPMQVKKMGNVYIVGDYTTDSAQGHPPMAPRVTACAAMMAEVVLDLALQ